MKLRNPTNVVLHKVFFTPSLKCLYITGGGGNTQELLINLICLLKICVDYSTGGKTKQISNGELNTIGRVTVTNLLYTHKHTPQPLSSLSEPSRVSGRLEGIVYV